jgi:hypothetical protein
MDEEISGDMGAPVVNAYSIYKNPLLSGTVTIPSTVTASSGSSAAAGYQSATSSYTGAVKGGLNDALQILGFSAADTATYANSFTNNNLQPLVSGNVIAQIKQIIDIIYRLKPFINSESVTAEEWQVLERFRYALDNDLVNQSQLTNARGVLNYVLNKVVEGIVSRINQPIRNVTNQSIVKLRSAINSLVVTPVNTRIETSLTAIFGKLQAHVMTLVDEEAYPAVIASFSVVGQNISNGIKLSVANSFENNVTSKVAAFVELGVTSKVTGFVRKEVTTAGNKLITEGASANIGLGNILQNGGAMLAGIADTVKDVIMKVNGSTFLKTGESIVDDAIAGINWDAVASQILNELIARGISSTLASQLSAKVSEGADPYVKAILNTVKFDFSNLGEKLQNGQFDKIVKFDPTNIYIVSPSVDIEGQVKFTKNDPVYGDSWQSNVMVRVKVPNKDNPLECTAYFLNGKTGQQAGNFSYWYVKLGVLGLNVQMKPTPITWDGVDGFAFSRMKKTGNVVIPDNTNKWGIGCKFYFYDKETSGETILFDLGAEAAFNDGGFSVQLAGNVSMLNFTKVAGKFRAPGLITGTGTLGYYKTPQYKKVAGVFTVKLNTDPLLCVGGELGFDLRTPENWKAWVGTQQNPVGIKVICKDFLTNTGYFEVKQSGFTAGLNMNVNISAQSPWLEYTGIKVRGFAYLNFGYHAGLAIDWDPALKINDATISASLAAAVGIEYQIADAATNTLTLAGVNLSGSLTYKSSPDAELRGSMGGNITILNYNLAFTTPVKYSLSKQQIVD